MKIIIKASGVFLYGIYADIYRRIFEINVEKHFLSGKSMSEPIIVMQSNKVYKIRKRLKHLTEELEAELL